MAPESSPQDPGKFRNVLCFFLFGLLTMVYEEIFLVAAGDLFSDSNLSTSVVILISVGPVLSVKMLVPWIMEKLQYKSKVFAIIALLFVGVLLIASTRQVHWRLLGVILVELGVAWSEVTFLALTAFYQDVTVKAFVCGFGSASLVGPLYYTATTKWSCLSPRNAVAATILLPVMVLVSFAALDTENIDLRVITLEKEQQAPKYALLKQSDEEDKPGAQAREELSWGEKWAATKRIAPQVAVLIVTYFSMHLTNRGLITTISFSNMPFAPRAHFSYYILSSKFGSFLGMSYMLLASYTCPKVLPYVRVRRTWFLALFIVSTLLLLVLDSWFRFVPHVAVTLGLCALEGFLAGAVYTNSALNVFDAFSDSLPRELGLGSLPRGNAIGEFLGVLVTLLVEPFLRAHCLQTLELGDECFGRISGSSSWFENMHCTPKIKNPPN